MRRHDRAYFEQDAIWDSALEPGERQCIELIRRLWPADATSLLDAGCGAGRLLNALDIPAAKFGTDFAFNPLRRVEAPVAAAAMHALPFADRRFDVSLCSNVLEHLTADDLKVAIAELDRVTRKYLMIVSPIDEPLETQLMVCDACAAEFHANGHRRAFSVTDFEALFPQFDLSVASFIGDAWLAMPRAAGAIERATGHDIHRFVGAVCPSCGHVAAPQSTPPDISSVVGALTPALWRGFPRGAPSSALVVLQRRAKAAAKVVLPMAGAGLWVEFPAARAARSISVEMLDQGTLDLALALDYVPAALATRGVVLQDPGSAWGRYDEPAGSQTRWIRPRADQVATAVFMLPASAVMGRPHILVFYVDRINQPLEVSLLDGVLGLVALGQIGGAGSGERIEARLALPVVWRPETQVAVFRITVPPGDPQTGIEVVSIRLTDGASEPMRVVAAEANAVAIEMAGTGPAAAMRVVSTSEPVTGYADARMIGCRRGRILVGSGNEVEFSPWLLHTGSTERTRDEAQRARLSAVIGASFLTLVDRAQDAPDRAKPDVMQAFFADLAEVVALHGSAEEAALIDRMASSLADARRGASAEPALPVTSRPAPARTSVLRRLETLETLRAELEDLITRRDRQIGELSDQLASAQLTASRFEAQRAELERMLTEKDAAYQSLARQHDSTLASASAFETQRVELERMLTEKDAAYQSLTRQHDSTLASASAFEARRQALEDIITRGDAAYQDLNRSYIAATDLANGLERTRADLDHALSEKLREHAELAGRYSATQLLADERLAAIQRLSDEHATAQGQVAALVADIERLTARCSSMKADLDRTIAAVAEREEVIADYARKRAPLADPAIPEALLQAARSPDTAWPTICKPAPPGE